MFYHLFGHGMNRYIAALIVSVGVTGWSVVTHAEGQPNTPAAPAKTEIPSVKQPVKSDQKNIATAQTANQNTNSTPAPSTSSAPAPAPTTTDTDNATTSANTDDKPADAVSTDPEAPVDDPATTASTALDDEPLPPPQKDPLEGFNRAMFTFNDTLDTYLLKPIATLYNKIMPVPLNKGIHNVFFNINTLPTIANDLLQAHFYQASIDTWRVGINTTIGIGGLFDMADRMQLKPYTNDFGLTLATWGYTDSTYLVLPFFGSNTIRDGVGLPVDYFVFSLYPYINPPSLRYQLYGLWVIDRRAQLLKFQDVMEEAAIDRYVFFRNAYMQRRNYQIENNKHRSCCDQRADSANAETPPPASDENYD